jgi:hypothetical protein
MRKTAFRTAALAAAALVLGIGAPAAFAQSDGVEIHLFVSQGYMKTSSTNNWVIPDSGKGSFEFNEFGVNLSKQLSPKMRVAFQLFAQDRGDIGNDKVTIDYAYGDYRFSDAFGVRLGKIKRPYGLYGETRDTDSLRTYILLPQVLYNERNRDTSIAQSGVGFYGTLRTKAAGSFAYQLQYGALPLDLDSGPVVDTELSYPVQVTGITADPAFAGSLEWNTPLPGLRIGATVSDLSVTYQTVTTPAALYSFKMPAGTPFPISLENFTVVIYSAEYTWRNLVVAGECVRTRGHIKLPFMNVPAVEEGWWAGGSYRINDLFEVGGYYSPHYRDPNDHGGSTYKQQRLSAPWEMWRKDLAMTLRIDPVKHFIVKFEGHKMDGTHRTFKSADNKQNWYAFLAKATFSF